jgi:DnaK suppressor protein
MTDANAVPPNSTLEQIRDRLLARRAELQHRKQRIELDLQRQHEPLSKDFDDQAIQLENDETLQAIGHAAARELEEIDVALARMARGLYGRCKNCGEEISAARLEAIPHASVCQRCGEAR